MGDVDQRAQTSGSKTNTFWDPMYSTVLSLTTLGYTFGSCLEQILKVITTHMDKKDNYVREGDVN